MRKYEFTGETTIYSSKILKRIMRLSDGAIGGWIESENNLSHYHGCWISDNAMVYGNAMVYDNAEIYDNARIYGNARISHNAKIYDNARVYGNAWVYDSAKVSHNAKVYGDAWVSHNAIVTEKIVFLYLQKHNAIITDSIIYWGRRQFMIDDLKEFQYEDCTESWDRDVFETEKKIVLEAAALKWGVDL